MFDAWALSLADVLRHCTIQVGYNEVIIVQVRKSLALGGSEM